MTTTTVEKRAVLEIVSFCVKRDLLTHEEAKQILRICNLAISRAVREEEGAG